MAKAVSVKNRIARRNTVTALMKVEAVLKLANALIVKTIIAKTNMKITIRKD